MAKHAAGGASRRVRHTANDDTRIILARTARRLRRIATLRGNKRLASAYREAAQKVEPRR